MDPDAPALWKMERFRDFLEARKELLAAALNRRLEDLLHGDTRWLASATAVAPVPQAADRHADVPRPLTHAALPRRFRAAARGGKMGA